MNRSTWVILGGLLLGILCCLILFSFLLFFQQQNAPPSGLVLASPTARQTPQAEVIASINLIDKELDDGSIQTVAELSIAPLSVGTFDLKAPHVMTVSRPSLVVLTIDPGSGLTELAQTPIDTGTGLPDEPDHLLNVTDELKIYPIMTAELAGASENFTIQDLDEATKPILFGQVVVWRWQVTPRQPGNKILFLQISIPVRVGDQILENAQMIAQRDVPIVVAALPTAVPTPTPSIGDRIVVGTQENIFFILLGLLVLVILAAGLWWVLDHRRPSSDSSFRTISAEGYSTEQLNRLLTLIDERFSAEELATLCFRLGMDYDDLPQGGKQSKARELIELCLRTSQVQRLIEEAEKARPGLRSEVINP